MCPEDMDAITVPELDWSAVTAALDTHASCTGQLLQLAMQAGLDESVESPASAGFPRSASAASVVSSFDMCASLAARFNSCCATDVVNNDAGLKAAEVRARVVLRCDLSDADLDWLSDLLFMPLYNDIHSGDKVLKTLRRLRFTGVTLLVPVDTFGRAAFATMAVGLTELCPAAVPLQHGRGCYLW